MFDRAKGADAADRARLLGEYMQRKNQAAVNKARAHGDIYGVSLVICIIPFSQKSTVPYIKSMPYSVHLKKVKQYPIAMKPR